jgi:hypothetical protein
MKHGQNSGNGTKPPTGEQKPLIHEMHLITRRNSLENTRHDCIFSELETGEIETYMVLDT